MVGWLQRGGSHHSAAVSATLGLRLRRHNSRLGPGIPFRVPTGTPELPPPTPPATPTLAFTSEPVFCCDPRSIVFEASTEGPKVPSGTQFRWEFGDGRTGEGERVEHTYAWPGDYTVILKADFRDGTVRSADARLSLPSEPAPFDQPATPPLSPGDNPDTSQSPSVPVDSVVAVAGDDRMAQPGTWVVLDGSASFGTGNLALAYMWRQIGGQAVSIVKIQPTCRHVPDSIRSAIAVAPNSN